MAININPGTPLRHVATYTASGNFTTPIGTTVAFVSVHSSTGGGGGQTGSGHQRYNGPSGFAGAGRVSGAFVEVIPGSTVAVTIGAGGAAGGVGSAGATGGTTNFDGAIFVPGSSGGAVGYQNGRYSFGDRPAAAADAVSATGTTSLTTLPPSSTTLTRTKTITGQLTGGAAGGIGSAGNNQAGGVGNSAIVHIYI